MDRCRERCMHDYTIRDYRFPCAGVPFRSVRVSEHEALSARREASEPSRRLRAEDRAETVVIAVRRDQCAIRVIVPS